MDLDPVPAPDPQAGSGDPGDDDPIVPLSNARILARLVPDARLEVLPGAGHLFLLDQAAEAAERVDAFLSG